MDNVSQDRILNKCPESKANFFSRITFWWFTPMARLGLRKPLTQDDLWELDTQNKTETVLKKFIKYWSKLKIPKTTVMLVRHHHDDENENDKAVKEALVEDTKPQSSQAKQTTQIGILSALLKTFWLPLLYTAFLKLIASCLTFVNPVVLDLLITFVSDDKPISDGIRYALIMLFASMLESLINSQYEYKINVIAMRMRSCIISTVYQKSLKLSNTGQKDFTTGEIVNLMAVDAQRVVDTMLMVNLLWAAPLQVCIAIYFLWGQLGVATLAGLGFMVLLLPFNGVITAKLRTQQNRIMKEKDKRTKLMNEILNGIKVLKLFAWENYFTRKINQYRKLELKALKKQAYLASGITFAFSCAPFFVALASFMCYVWMDKNNVLTANKAFVSLSLFNILRVPLALVPILVTFGIMALVSIKRINKYLHSEELDPSNVNHGGNEDNAVVIERGTFSWKKDEEPILKDINLNIKQKKLIAVVGVVGSGKSSLLSALLGEMYKKSGDVSVTGTIAYVPQQAWIKNETVRQNILFAKPMDEKRYRKVLDVCALNPDLKVLEGGDQCEIGEKGINLSGGQKQRISLARAVYFDADIYLLDDPLSAVDVHVSRHLFDKVIGPEGILKTKTRILVTHRITILPRVDEIIVLKDGQISERGSYQELLAKKGDFAEILVQYLDQNEDAAELEDPDQVAQLQELKQNPKFARKLSRSTSETGSESSSSDVGIKRSVSVGSPPDKPLSPLKSKARLVEDEAAQVEAVKLAVYFEYFRAMGLLAVFAIMVFCLFSSGFNVFTNLWLTLWSNENLNTTTSLPFSKPMERNVRLGVYAGLGCIETVFVLLFALTLNIACVNGAGIIHDKMLNRVVQAPMSFFDTTPVGRVLNRFSKDIDTADTSIRFNLRLLVMTFFKALTALLLVCLQTPLFIIAAIPLSIFYHIVQKYYVATSRQLRRIESVTRSPIYTHFSESVTGSSSIRAYNVSNIFIKECHNRVDTNHASSYASIVAGRWLSVRLEFLGYTVVLLAAMFAVFFRDSVSPGLAGLSITYALTITATLNMLVRASSDVETNIVAVERCLEYSKVNTEAPAQVEGRKPDPDWPKEGKISFVNYSMRYRDGLQLALKNATCQINPREKVGIVGRTGAGKSSFTLALFRIVEPATGSIIIDDIDITTIGLHDLRSRLTIIPQDPVLFTGTLRFNLDPSEEIPDEELWRALELSSLKPYVSSLEGGLSHEVSEGGENLSVGQRQLLCLARAILRRTKILVLDEATAAVDYETDAMIQKTIRTEFKNCTVVTIAHRLNTVIDYDRLLVLSRGEIAEFDSPKNLMAKKDSIFYGMAKDAGLI